MVICCKQNGSSYFWSPWCFLTIETPNVPRPTIYPEDPKDLPRGIPRSSEVEKSERGFPKSHRKVSPVIIHFDIRVPPIFFETPKWKKK